MNLIVILGPTATGKTRLAVQLAHAIRGEIISADSRQVYKGLDIGTGKDLKEYRIEDKSIPYYLIDILDPMEEYNVSKFQKDFQKISKDIQQRYNLPILCGGTGFYIKAVLLDFKIPSVNPDKKLRAELESLSLVELSEKLESISGEVSSNFPGDTKRRVIRAIEIALQGEGLPAVLPARKAQAGAAVQAGRKEKGNRRRPACRSHGAGREKGERKKETGDGIKETGDRRRQKLRKTLVLGIDYSREVIRQRITTRLHQRLEEGMINEVEGLLQKGIPHERLDDLGLEYRYISRYLEGHYGKEEMVSLLNTAIHQFAKKQMTFFRNMEKNGIQIHWIPEGDFNKAIKLISEF